MVTLIRSASSKSAPIQFICILLSWLDNYKNVFKVYYNHPQIIKNHENKLAIFRLPIRKYWKAYCCHLGISAHVGTCFGCFG